LGLLTRTLPVANELRQRGHQAAFCNPAAAPARLIAEAGFENLRPKHPLFYFEVAGESRLKDIYRQFTSPQFQQDFGGWPNFLKLVWRSLPVRIPRPTLDIWNMDHFWALFGALNAGYVRASVEAYLALIRDFAADAVIDSFNLFACLAARAARCPLVSILQADVHPASRGFIWWKPPPPQLPDPTPVVNRLLAGYGLPPVEKASALHVGDLPLVLGIPETDPLPADAGAAYLGPILWQKPGATLPEWVAALGRERPVIWIYLGNPRYFPFARLSMDGEVGLRICIAALADEPVQVVLTAGHHALPKSLLPLPANFHFAPFLPGLAMAGQSNLMIHHGGYGSCQTGLAAGVPAVILPNFSERESNARRVAGAGAGLCLLPENGRQVSPAALRSAVRQALAEPSFVVHARRISQVMQAYGGAEEAARRVEAILT
jgi:UDP:flavonoid glycosyltransferase YjiC (YdhE family)